MFGNILLVRNIWSVINNFSLITAAIVRELFAAVNEKLLTDGPEGPTLTSTLAGSQSVGLSNGFLKNPTNR